MSPDFTIGARTVPVAELASCHSGLPAYHCADPSFLQFPIADLVDFHLNLGSPADLSIAFAFVPGALQALGVHLTPASVHVARLTVTRLTDPAPTPEPASWALLILGFAAAGAVLRRRRGPGIEGHSFP